VTKTPQRRILGCLFFSAATWHIKDRDQWIGWTKKDREKRLNLIVNNKRFLILPWVKVPNLASSVLSQALQQLREDWYQVHAYRPVLVETFVDDSRTRAHVTMQPIGNALVKPAVKTGKTGLIKTIATARSNQF